MTDGLVVGVDVGSSAARAVAIDRRGRVAGTSTSAYAATRPGTPGECDPRVWLDAMCAALRGLACDIPVALCVGGQGPATVTGSGEWAITFRHPEIAPLPIMEQQAAQADLLAERSGEPVTPWQMWDYLVAVLGGSSRFQSLWPSIPALPGFGKPVPVGSRVGVTSGEHGLPAGIVLASGGNDAFMTVWADAVDTPGKGMDPGGKTGGLGVAIPSDDPRADALCGVAGAARGISIVGGPVASHGGTLDWWAGITGRTIPELMEAAGRIEPGARGVTALPFLEGEREPRWSAALRAELHGLRPDSDVGVITRALLESTAYGLAHIARTLADQGVEVHRVVSSGGPSRSEVWTRIKASVLGVPFDVPDCRQMAAYGAALGAGAAMGWWPRPGEGARGDWPSPPVTTIEPAPEPVYEEGLERFIALGDQAEARLGGASPLD